MHENSRQFHDRNQQLILELLVYYMIIREASSPSVATGLQYISLLEL